MTINREDIRKELKVVFNKLADTMADTMCDTYNSIDKRIPIEITGQVREEVIQNAVKFAADKAITTMKNANDNILEEVKKLSEADINKIISKLVKEEHVDGK